MVLFLKCRYGRLKRPTNLGTSSPLTSMRATSMQSPPSYSLGNTQQVHLRSVSLFPDMPLCAPAFKTSFSAGKTTFVKHLLQREYPGINIGPEPTTDRFVVVMDGMEERRTPGNTLIVQPDKPFQVQPSAGRAHACSAAVQALLAAGGWAALFPLGSSASLFGHVPQIRLQPGLHHGLSLRPQLMACGWHLL